MCVLCVENVLDTEQKRKKNNNTPQSLTEKLQSEIFSGECILMCNMVGIAWKRRDTHHFCRFLTLFAVDIHFSAHTCARLQWWVKWWKSTVCEISWKIKLRSLFLETLLLASPFLYLRIVRVYIVGDRRKINKSVLQGGQVRAIRCKKSGKLKVPECHNNKNEQTFWN